MSDSIIFYLPGEKLFKFSFLRQENLLYFIQRIHRLLTKDSIVYLIDQFTWIQTIPSQPYISRKLNPSYLFKKRKTRTTKITRLTKTRPSLLANVYCSFPFRKVIVIPVFTRNIHFPLETRSAVFWYSKSAVASRETLKPRRAAAGKE